MSLLVGFHMPNFTFPGTPDVQLFDRVVELATTAERVGFDLLTVMDHQYQIGGIGPEEDPMLEPYAVLPALAMVTSRVRLGTLVTGVTYRNPALLAKTVTTLDVISKGRAVYGIGAAWNEDEHRGYGIEFPPIRERMDRLEEALQIAKAMFRDERATVEGVHYRVENALNNPKPVQPGGPPILVGGGGEQRTLRIAARYADWSNWFGQIADLERKHALLDRYCEEIGRDPSDDPANGHPAAHARPDRGRGGCRPGGCRACAARDPASRDARDPRRARAALSGRRVRWRDLPDRAPDHHRLAGDGRRGDPHDPLTADFLGHVPRVCDTVRGTAATARSAARLTTLLSRFPARSGSLGSAREGVFFVGFVH